MGSTTEDVITLEPTLRSLHGDYRLLRDRLATGFGIAGREEYARMVWERHLLFAHISHYTPESKFLALADSRRFDSALAMLAPQAHTGLMKQSALFIRWLVNAQTALRDVPRSIALARRPTGETGLHIAARYGCEPLGAKLLALGANPKETTVLGWNTLHVAARYGQTWFVQRLLAAGVPARRRCYAGRTPLSLAAEHGHSACMLHLITAPRAEINSADILGYTPLTYALLGNHTAALVLLLTAGADLTVRDKQGRDLPAVLHAHRVRLTSENQNLLETAQLTTALRRALKQPTEGVNLLRPTFSPLVLQLYALAQPFGSAQRETAQAYLAKALQRPRLASGSAEGRMFAAFQRGAYDEVRQIIHQEQPDLGARDCQGLTLLHRAVSRRQGSLIYFLSRRGVKPDVPDLLGQTPLMWACQLGDVSISRQLLEDLHANPACRDSADETALEYAHRNGNSSLIRFMQSASVRQPG